jgi:hypothetical protein
MHANVVDLLMSMTLALARALITTAFRGKQTALIHSLTYSMQRRLTLPFRSAEYTHTVALQVMRLRSLIRPMLNDFLLLSNKETRKEKKIEVDVRTHSYNYRCPTSIMRICDSLISFKHQLMHI